MKTLYVSDLDGTLLQRTQRTSEFTNRTINELVARGMMFSYATARGYGTAKSTTHGLSAKIPLIVYNGAFIMDNVSGERIYANYFGGEVDDVILDLIRGGVYPIVYSILGGHERFSYVEKKCSAAALSFVSTRDDDRKTPLDSECGLFSGERYYITCIDDEQKLRPFHEKYKDAFHCVYDKDIYSGNQWLEIMPKDSCKSRAAAKLKELLGCDKLVVFGDGLNDADLFDIADECYAVANAAPQLKEKATAVIGSNDSDGVAHWLTENYK